MSDEQPGELPNRISYHYLCQITQYKFQMIGMEHYIDMKMFCKW